MDDSGRNRKYCFTSKSDVRWKSRIHFFPFRLHRHLFWVGRAKCVWDREEIFFSSSSRWQRRRKRRGNNRSVFHFLIGLFMNFISIQWDIEKFHFRSLLYDLWLNIFICITLFISPLITSNHRIATPGKQKLSTTKRRTIAIQKIMFYFAENDYGIIENINK